MANAKAIKAKIKSISNIQKITSALEVVSTVKLQKVKQQADNFKQYMNEFLYILDMVDFSKIFQDTQNTAKKDLLIIVGTEKGLCGALNSKLFKKIYDETKDEKDKYDVFVVGKKALEFFTRTGYNIVGVLNLKDTFSEADLADLRGFVVKALEDKKYRNINIFFNYFKNTMVQIPTKLQLFPLLRENFEEFAKTIELDVNIDDEVFSDIIIEPSEEEFYDFVMKKFIADMVY
jgi:F-type H+-transporting ATPase subunit gamma